MRRAMPISLIAAEVAIAPWLVYIAILLWLDIQCFQSGIWRLLNTAIHLFNLAWGVSALVGITFNCRVAWRFACAASVISGMLGLFGGIFFIFVGSFVSSFDLCGSLAIRSFGIALYLFVIYFLLNWSTSAAYFKNQNGDATSA